MNSLSRVLAGLSEAQAVHVYNALAQWADNERCGLEEDSPVTPDETAARGKHDVAVSSVESVVALLELEIVGLAAR